MAARTKSFFEKDHSNKARQTQWHRGQDRTPLSDRNANSSCPKPPIPATSQTKSKLKSFQFVPGQPEEPVQDQRRQDGTERNEAESAPALDNAEIIEEAVEQADASVVDMAAFAHDKTTSDTPQLSHGHTFPCTPGTRLPLEDLICNFDEFSKTVVQAPPSPEEHIGWIPNSSSNLLTPSRKRKRAKSSSPSCPNTSSQRQEASALLSTAANGEKATPETDPAADLWKRYATGKVNDEASKLPDFDQIMFEASPRRLETPAKSAGLRRWASTGNDWPTSKSKRRRTQGISNMNVMQEQQNVESGGKSKVATIVERLQESLASQKLSTPQQNPELAIQAPSSSSPLPDAGGPLATDGNSAPSPLQDKQFPTEDPSGVLRVPSQERRLAQPVRGTSTKVDIATRPVVNTSHDKPGPDNATSIISAPLKLGHKAPLPAFRRPTMSRTPSGGRQYPQRLSAPVPTPAPATVKPARPAPVPNVNLDEFGDDFDFSAEDLEELMANPPPVHQRPLHQIPAHPNPPPPQPSEVEARQNAHMQGAQAKQPIVIDEFDDDDGNEFGLNDIDDAAIAQMEISPRRRTPANKYRNASSPTSKTTNDRPLSSTNGKFRRYLVKQIADGEHTNAKGRRCLEKVVVAEEDRTLKTVAITLRDSWVDTPLAKEDIVHVTAARSAAGNGALVNELGQITISDAPDSLLLVVHPDQMLTATSIADSFDCSRKALLQQRIRSSGDSHKAMVYGNILHEIFQKSLSANQWAEQFLAEMVEETVQSHVEDLWQLGMVDTVLAIEEIKGKMGEMSSWARIFVARSPSEVATIDGRQGDKARMSISKLIAIEEHIWSPQYGLQGKIDATVQMTHIEQTDGRSKKLLYPFEVKTGRTTFSAMHMAQTALYTLMLSDRYDTDVTTGILYYLESSAMSRIDPPLAELRQMLQQRNRLASLIHRARSPLLDEAELAPQTQEIETSGLPGLLRNPFKCGKCFAKTSCFTYHALTENGSAESAGMIDDGKKNYGAIWAEDVGHLTVGMTDQTQPGIVREWFTKWDRLLTFEERNMSKLLMELWTMDSSEREAVGRCFGNLVIAREVTPNTSASTALVADGIEGVGGKINRFAYVLVRKDRTAGQSFAEGSQLTVGEVVVVSSEAGQWGLAKGYVTAVTKHEITIAVDRKLGDARQRLPGFDNDRNQTFKGIMTVGDGQESDQTSVGPTILYRLDKDEFSNGLAVIRNNLLTMMSSHPIHTKLRNHIMFSADPTFAASTSTPVLAPSQLGDMNEDQKATVAKVLAAQDYALILGMPGTGKTTTIAHIVRALLAEGKSILISSFTHTAVDNILLKIQDVVPPKSIMRLGTVSKINAHVQEFCQLATDPRKTIQEVEEAYMGCRIVATTCMGTNHAVFTRRAFDICIVDEASQITLPISLGPLLHARKFVLVGDHYQLPPLVQNRHALEGGLDVSLFRQLTEEHPEAVATLGKQYRMCEEIMTLANILIYSGQLRCGTDAVAQRKLQDVDVARLSTFHNSSSACTKSSFNGKCWLQEICSPERKVVYANIDLSGKAAFENLTTGKNITNQLEATIAAQTVMGLLAIGVPAKEIGVITLYRSQLALLRRLFKIAGIAREVDIDSADRFQGRDKECIVLSMVRSNAAGVVGDLLKDWRRVNVALTRAKSKLVVLGSRQTLRNNDLLAKFLNLVDEKGWSIDLPNNADAGHAFDFSSQTTSGIPVQSSPTAKAVNSVVSLEKRSLAASPLKTPPSPSSRVLCESRSAANRSPAKSQGVKKPGKVITGRAGGKKKLQHAAIEIFEDLITDDL